jgi:Uma2 family endonuclease
MATITDPMITPTDGGLPLYRLSVDEYERMAEAGVLDDPRVELIDGYLVRKMTKKPDHVIACDALFHALLHILPPAYWLRMEAPVRIPEFDEPEPDLSVVRGSRGDYSDHHPGPGDIALLVEVAESSLARDRGRKLSAYAKAGVPEYWIVNLEDRVVERYTAPAPELGRYEQLQVLGPDQELPVVIDGLEHGRIALAGILSKIPRPGD